MTRNFNPTAMLTRSALNIVALPETSQISYTLKIFIIQRSKQVELKKKNIFNSFVGFPLLPSHSRTQTSKFMTNTIWEISQVNSEQMTKVSSARLHSLALCCAMQFPNLAKDFIIQPKQTTVSLHLERWMHSNLNFFHWMCVFCREISSSIFLEWHDTFNNQCRSAQMKCVNFQWLFECFSFTRTRLENIFRILKWSERDICFGAVESACKLNICWKIVEILYQHFVMSLTHNATMRRPSELACLQIWQNMHCALCYLECLSIKVESIHRVSCGARGIYDRLQRFIQRWKEIIKQKKSREILNFTCEQHHDQTKGWLNL